jgi:hypothetical protein
VYGGARRKAEPSRRERIGAVFYKESDDFILSVLGSPVEGVFTRRVSIKQATTCGPLLEKALEYGSPLARYRFGYAKDAISSGCAIQQRRDQR